MIGGWLIDDRARFSEHLDGNVLEKWFWNSATKASRKIAVPMPSEDGGSGMRWMTDRNVMPDNDLVLYIR